MSEQSTKTGADKTNNGWLRRNAPKAIIIFAAIAALTAITKLPGRGWTILNDGSAVYKNIKIRGKLDSDDWGTTAGSRIDMDGGYFYFGGSAAPKLSWNGTTLSIEGAIKATSGEFTGTLKATDIDALSTLTVKGAMQSNNYIWNVSGWYANGIGQFFVKDIIVVGDVQAAYITAATYTMTPLLVFAAPPVSPGLMTLYRSSDGLHLYFKDSGGVVHTLV